VGGVVAIHWGVDSLNAADSLWPQGVQPKNQKKLWHVVYERFGKRIPEFWGRYIVGTTALTQAEANYLLNPPDACRILPIYNQCQPWGGEARGVADAEAAIRAAGALGIPANVFIYADIEAQFNPTKAWILGWWKRMYNSPYGGCGGFYCSPVKRNFRFLPAYAPALVAAMAQIAQANAANTPSPFGTSVNRRIWSNTHKRVVPQALAGLTGPDPQIPNYADVGKPDPITLANGTIVSDIPAVWQYAVDCLQVKGPKSGLVDLNLANDDGFDAMWQP
jgi:hypothetical protein